MANTTRRELDRDEIDDAKRLAEVFRQRKAELKAQGIRMTQESLAHDCGWRGQSAVSQYVNARIPLNLDALVKLSAALNAACATVRGDSMLPVLPDGTCIGIDRGTTDIVDGEIYAIDHDGMLRVKYLYRMPLGRVRIASENDSEYPDEIVSGDDLQFLRIIGRVFWFEVIRPRR